MKYFFYNNKTELGLIFLILIFLSVQSSSASKILTPCDIEATDPEGNPYTFQLTNTVSGVSIDTNTGIITGSTAIEGTHTIRVEATDEYGASSLPYQYSLTVNNYCGDGVRQILNMEGQGGPANNGAEDCDGQDGIAINPSDSVGTGKMYACSGDCVEGSDCTGTCTFLDNASGGGWCGDGFVQTAFGENCDPLESQNSYESRNGLVLNSLDAAKWQALKSSCDPTDCTMGCVGDPLLAEGCYIDADNSGVIDGGECEKGKYTCENDSLVCSGVFEDAGLPKKFDYCCLGTPSSLSTAGDGSPGDIGVFNIVRADPADTVFTSTGGIYGSFLGTYPGAGAGVYHSYYTCDYVCKQSGQVCIGVGLNNHVIDSCISIVHDTGSGCVNPVNAVNDDCKSLYSLAGNSNAVAASPWWGVKGYLGTCSDGSNPSITGLTDRFHVGETACYCQ